MNNKKELILQEIRRYYEVNKLMPSIRYLQKTFNYQSTNTIYKYLISLEDEGYLTRNSYHNLVLNNYSNKHTIRNIKILNSKRSLSLYLDNDHKYTAFVNQHNYFEKYNILKGDILIIKKKNKLQNNDLGLFLINNQYKIMKYTYKNGFYILEDIEEIILHKVKIIGKVVMVERKIKALI